MPLPLAPLVASALSTIISNPETVNKIVNFVVVLVYILIAVSIFFVLLFIYFIYRMFFASDSEEFRTHLRLKTENFLTSAKLLAAREKRRQRVLV